MNAKTNFWFTIKSAVAGLWPHVADSRICRSSAGRCLIIHPISRTLRPVISIFFLHLKKFLSVQRLRFQIDRGGDECLSGSNSRRQTSTHDTKIGSTVWFSLSLLFFWDHNLPNNRSPILPILSTPPPHLIRISLISSSTTFNHFFPGLPMHLFPPGLSLRTF